MKAFIALILIGLSGCGTQFTQPDECDKRFGKPDFKLSSCSADSNPGNNRARTLGGRVPGGITPG